MRSRLLLILVAFLCATAAFAQKAEEPGIQDNSLLTEEAYNQDPGVVQHINFFQRDQRTHEWIYTFTEEWPAPNLTHQLSYTLPLQRLDGQSSRIGDVALNYRYQLLGDADAKLAATPRVTVTLPTGDWRRREGSGAVGYNVAMAVSYVPRADWNIHFDAGIGDIQRARSVDVARTDLRAASVANNIVWLPSKRWNLMLETVFTRAQSFDGWSNSAIVSPAIRWAYNFPSGLQVVPAVGFPIGVGPSAGERSVILYLSFEHPFRHVTK
jgi:hypothetical protein